MKIRKLGDEEGSFREYADQGCPWCNAGKHVDWTQGDVIFFENDAGEVRRVEVLLRSPWLLLNCGKTTRELAGAELLAACDSPRDAGGSE